MLLALQEQKLFLIAGLDRVTVGRVEGMKKPGWQVKGRLGTEVGREEIILKL